jgi:hypothetical protein
MIVTEQQLRRTYRVDGSTGEQTGESGQTMFPGAHSDLSQYHFEDPNGIGWQLVSFIIVSTLILMTVGAMLGEATR